MTSYEAALGLFTTPQRPSMSRLPNEDRVLLIRGGVSKRDLYNPHTAAEPTAPETPTPLP